MKVKSLIGLILALLITFGLVYTAGFGFTLKSPFTGNEYKFPKVMDEEDGIVKGLDLVGGSVISFEADINGTPDAADMDAAEKVLRNRLDSKGYFDALVTKQGDKVLRVEIPNINNPEEAVQMLGETAKLTFTDYDGNVIMEGGTDVAKATSVYGQTKQDGPYEYYVQLTLTSAGQAKFAQATEAAAARQQGENVVKILLDKTEISAPRVSEKINDTTCIISGNFTEASAKALADQIQSGQLPFALRESELRSVGPSLGSTALSTGLIAGAWGILLIFLIMILKYRLPGLMASIALVIYIALTGLILAGYVPGGLRPTLTLPGIAGVILSIGMSVDANVIIFERIKEEIFAGKSTKSAIDLGFYKALSAIIDSNITTVIAAVVLWKFGTGTIQGFALTLGIGVILSMFTAIFVTKFLLNTMVGLNIKNPILYGVNRREEL